MRHALAVVAAAALLALGATAHADEEIEPGERIYQQQCASCHGDDGQGVRDQFTGPLTGDKSPAQLSTYIHKWMPEEDPETVVDEDAELVARYIYDKFYSPIAQARNRPASVELSRLTAGQYRQAVADVIGSFRPTGPIGEERGLRGEYYNDRRPGPNRVAERNDDQLAFHWDAPSEVADDLQKEGFAARWRGSLIAPETGRYEIIVHTDHGARLWLNDMDNALIDAWVVSGDDTEHKATVFLVGGRAYPLRLDFTSRNQGVQKDEENPDPVAGFIELQWKQPKHEVETVPSRYLSPKNRREVFVSETAFPPDDRSVGYERGTSISKAWHRATTDAAIEAAAHVTEHLEELAGKAENDEQREQKLRAFAQQFVERAFRRPLDDDQRKLYIDRQFETAPNLEAAVKRVALFTLTSPRFLYLDFGKENPDDYDIATRLSFTIWDSIPDRQLIEAAADGRLSSPDEVRRQARRMIDDLRTRPKMRQFFHHWLHLGHNEDMVKASELYPEFDDQVISDLRTSLDMFIDEVVWGEDPDFRRLLREKELYVNGRIAEYYGFDLPADAPFQKVPADRPERRGVLTHPYVMAVFAYTDTTSPIHRGVFLARGLLGRTLRPPPEAFTPLSPDLHPDLTTRQRVAKQTEPASCMACHELINPLGFTLEQFDAVGRFRQTENDKPIDSSGSYELPSGEVVEFEHARDLAEFLADNEQTHEAFVLQLFHHLVKQPIRGYGQSKPTEMAGTFAEHKFDIHDLVVEIAATAALSGREEGEAKSEGDTAEAASSEKEKVSVAEPGREP